MNSRSLENTIIILLWYPFVLLYWLLSEWIIDRKKIKIYLRVLFTAILLTHISTIFYESTKPYGFMGSDIESYGFPLQFFTDDISSSSLNYFDDIIDLDLFLLDVLFYIILLFISSKLFFYLKEKFKK